MHLEESPKPILEVDGLSKSYGSVAALQDVSFNLLPGEIYGVLGQNGAGKTTALECLLGLRQPDAGRILFYGIDVSKGRLDLRARIGAQLQSASLQDKITPREALRLFASFASRPGNVDQLIERFGLVEKAEAAFSTLSTGQKQRLFLALAMVGQPDVLVLDEPTAGLDPISRRELHRIIRELKIEGKSVVLSTHNLEEAAVLCDRVGILHRGRLLADSSPASLVAKSGRQSRILFRVANSLAANVVSAFPGIFRSDTPKDHWEIGTKDPNRSVVELIQLLQLQGNELLELAIHQPTLEDVFIELTGQTWSSDEAKLE